MMPNKIPVTNCKKDYAASIHNEPHKERIRSGVQFFYRDGGTQSTIFEIRMKEPLNDNSLEKALEKTFLRYPYFTYKVVEEDGNFYLVDNPLPMVPKKTKQLYSLGSADTNYHIFDVTYYDKSIYLSLHHGFCDGQGIMAFAKTLIYYYCTYNYNHKFELPGVRLAGEPLLDGETKEPFSGLPSDTDREAKVPTLNCNGFILPESMASIDAKTGYRYEVKIGHDKFMKVAKANNATPAILISLLMARSMKEIHPNTEKPITCLMASDMRKGIHLENTYKNCTTTLTLPYDNEFERLSLREQATAFREKIKEVKDPDFIAKEVDNYKFMLYTLDRLETHKEKKALFSSFDHLVTNTFIVSYIGQSVLGNCEDYVDSMHSYGSGGAGITVEIFAFGDYFVLDYMQSFESDLYVSAFAKVMREMGMEVSVSDIIKCETPAASV